MELKKIKIALFMLAITFVNNTYAQDASPKVKEVGLGFYNFDSYSLQYRWGNEKRLFRINGSIDGGSNNFKGKSTDYAVINDQSTIRNNETNIKRPVDLSFNLSFSILKLKAINEKFGILHGLVFGTNYGYYKQKTKFKNTIQQNGYDPSLVNENTRTETMNVITPNFGIALGAYYKINSSFLLYAEIDPQVYFNYRIEKNITESPVDNGYQNTQSSNNKQHNFGISGLRNSGASLTLAYRF